MTRRPRSLAAVMAVGLLAAATLGGCSRKTDVVVIPADSTHTLSADSMTQVVRQTQEAWESGGGLETAAASTARLLALRLHGTPASSWHEHAGELLDSLNIGAEIADAPCVMVANFFPRSDPEAGSWPYVFYCAAQGPAYQALEGKNLHLQSAMSRGLHDGPPTPEDSVRLLAAAFTRRAPGGVQPLVMTWNLPKPNASKWSLVQTLGADSLGFGSAEFEAPSDTGATLAARTYKPPRGFVECATCPHVYTMNRFRWTAQGFTRSESKRVASPYATFADFIGALTAGDHVRAADRVSDPELVAAAEGLEWNIQKGAWRPAPGDGESPSDMTFFRGPKDAYSVHFRTQGGDWVITGFEPAKRTVE